MTKIITEEKPTITRLMSEINRKFGANTIGTGNTLKNLAISRVTTGIAKFDEALGGGFPLGRMVELYGPEHSGKSLVALLAIKNAQTMGLECIYVDAENSFDPIWAQKLGVDTSKLAITQMSIAEDVINTVGKLLEAEPAIIVVDSIAALITRSEIEEDMDQQFMAPKARLLSRGLGVLTAKNKKTLIIFVNQLRSTLAMYGAPTTTPGGKSLKHFASIRVEIKRDSALITATGKKTDPDVIGQIVLYKVTKNKTAQPFQYGSFRLLYDKAVIEE